MNKTRFFLLIICSIFCLNATAGSFVIKVVKVTGPAQFRRTRRSKWRTIKVKVELKRGYQVKTGPKAEVSLEIPGKGLVKVHERSLIRLQLSNLHRSPTTGWFSLFGLRGRLY